MSRDLVEVCIEVNETDEQGKVMVDGQSKQRPFVSGKPHLPHKYTVDKDREYVYRIENKKVIAVGIAVNNFVTSRREFGDLYTKVRPPQRHEKEMIKEYFLEKGYSNVKFLLD